MVHAVGTCSCPVLTLLNEACAPVPTPRAQPLRPLWAREPTRRGHTLSGGKLVGSACPHALQRRARGVGTPDSARDGGRKKSVRWGEELLFFAAFFTLL